MNIYNNYNTTIKCDNNVVYPSYITGNMENERMQLIPYRRDPDQKRPYPCRQIYYQYQQHSLLEVNQ